MRRLMRGLHVDVLRGGEGVEDGDDGGGSNDKGPVAVAGMYGCV